MNATKTSRIYWTEDEQEAIISGLVKLVLERPADIRQAIHIKQVEKVMHEVLPSARWRVLNWKTVKNFEGAVHLRLKVKGFFQKPTVEPKATIPVPTPMKRPMTRLAKPTTLDLQITGMVRSELQVFEKAIASSLLERMDLMLRDMERKHEAALLAFEGRVRQAWGLEDSAQPEPQAAPVKAIPEKKAEGKARILVACLRADQHQLVRKHLGWFNDMMDLTILEQDVPLTGLKPDSFDKVFLLSKFIGHSMSAKVQSRFGRDRCTTLSGASLSTAAAIKVWLAKEWIFQNGSVDPAQHGT